MSTASENTTADTTPSLMFIESFVSKLSSSTPMATGTMPLPTMNIPSIDLRFQPAIFLFTFTTAITSPHSAACITIRAALFCLLAFGVGADHPLYAFVVIIGFEIIQYLVKTHLQQKQDATATALAAAKVAMEAMRQTSDRVEDFEDLVEGMLEADEEYEGGEDEDDEGDTEVEDENGDKGEM